MNRQQRRQQERAADKQARKLGNVSKQAVMAEHGVEVDSLADGVVATFHSPGCNFTIKWRHQDAVAIGQLIVDAGNQAGGKVSDVVVERESGLVVANRLPDA